MNNKLIKDIIDDCIHKFPCEIEIRYNEPMHEHTTFKVGGKADCYLRPSGEGFLSFCVNLLNTACKAKISVFILGGGANIVVSDKGIRGIVLDMRAWNGESVWSICTNNSNDEFVLKSGTTIDEACDAALAASLSGFEFLAGMPGTIGGAVWMNARCYGREVADILSWVEIIYKQEKDEHTVKRIEVKKGLDFEYKKSPFQEMDCLIISAAFKLTKGDKEKIIIEMEKNREDRLNKGHYDFPSAGSAFKNNHNFGKPSGQIIDELGLKGLSIGGAQIAPFHGNIVINKGNARAKDIRTLMDKVAKEVKIKTGFVLEPEILFVGDWK